MPNLTTDQIFNVPGLWNRDDIIRKLAEEREITVLLWADIGMPEHGESIALMERRGYDEPYVVAQFFRKTTVNPECGPEWWHGDYFRDLDEAIRGFYCRINMKHDGMIHALNMKIKLNREIN